MQQRSGGDHGFGAKSAELRNYAIEAIAIRREFIALVRNDTE
jgi:hypothetical protein